MLLTQEESEYQTFWTLASILHTEVTVALSANCNLFQN